MKYKIVFFGAEDTGKSWLVSVIAGRSVKPINSTIGAEVVNVYQQNEVELEIWDTSGQARCNYVYDTAFPDAHVGILTFDNTLAFTEQQADLEKRIKQFRKTPSCENVPLILVATKCDEGKQKRISFQKNAESLKKIDGTMGITHVIYGISANKQETVKLLLEQIYQAIIKHQQLLEQQARVEQEEVIEVSDLGKNTSTPVIKPSEEHFDATHYKLVFFGESGTGKSEILKAVSGAQNLYSTGSNEQSSLVGHYSFVREYEVGQKVKFETWDLAGKKKVQDIWPMYFKGATAGILALDSTRPFAEQEQVLKVQIELFKKSDGCAEIPLVVVVTKWNLESERKISVEDLKQHEMTLKKQGVTRVIYDTNPSNKESVEALFKQIHQDIIDCPALDMVVHVESGNRKSSVPTEVLPPIKKRFFKPIPLRGWLYALVIVLGILLGAAIMGGLAAGFIFGSPFMLVAATLAVKITTGVLAIVLGGIMGGALASLTVLVGAGKVAAFGFKALLLASLLTGLTGTLLFSIAPPVGVLVVATLGWPMAIISLLAMSMVVALMSNAVETVLTFKITADSRWYWQLLKVGLQTLLVAGLMGGLAAGVMFGAAPVLLPISAVLITGNLGLTISVLILSALGAGFILAAIDWLNNLSKRVVRDNKDQVIEKVKNTKLYKQYLASSYAKVWSNMPPTKKVDELQVIEEVNKGGSSSITPVKGTGSNVFTSVISQTKPEDKKDDFTPLQPTSILGMSGSGGN